MCVCICVHVRVFVFVGVFIGCWMEAMSAYESMLYSNLGAEEDREERDGGGRGKSRRRKIADS